MPILSAGAGDPEPGKQDLSGLLRVLADCLDVPMPEDVEDGHQRWALYRRAIFSEACTSQLFAAIALEPDDMLVEAVVTPMMERAEGALREQWIGIVRMEKGRQYASRRAMEVDVLRNHAAISDIDQVLVASWTDWLQVRLAETSTVGDVLEQLARYGRTKRIRRTAAQRLAQ